MSCRYWVCGAGRDSAILGAFGLVGVLLVAACTDFKKSIGLEPGMPDEFAVESRAPLTIPPEFDLRPPTPGAPRPQEKSADQQAKDVFQGAGPGEPGKQASDSRLRRSEAGLPDIGAPGRQSPDPNAAVADRSLSGKLLEYGDTSTDSGTVDKRETSPLKGVY
jgi:hypothetical protein